MSILDADVLSLIFADLYHQIPTPSTTTTLRSVSASWMALAGRLPCIWTKIVLKKASDFGDSERTLFYVKNSGTLPLDLQLSLPERVSLDTKEAWEVISLLGEHVDRIRTFNINAWTQDGLEFLLSIGKNKAAPTLEELSITINTIPDGEMKNLDSLSGSFTPAPRLQRLRVPTYPCPESPHSFPSVTSLTLDGSPFASGATMTFRSIIVSAADSLQHFKYDGSEDGWSMFGQTMIWEFLEAIYLPNLTTLDLAVPGISLDILSGIWPPELTSLRLQGWCAEGDEWTDRFGISSIYDLLDHISPYWPDLVKLELAFPDLDVSPVIDYGTILRGEMFPRLEELVLDTTDITDEQLVAGGGSGLGVKKLSLVRCKNITGVGLLEFLAQKDSDFEITVKSCQGISRQDLDGMAGIVKVSI